MFLVAKRLCQRVVLSARSEGGSEGDRRTDKPVHQSRNWKTRQEASQGTTVFLQDQMDSARKSLSEQEAKVRQFESEHQGYLPSQQASNLQILSGLQSQLQNEQDSLNTAEQQRVYFQALIEQNRAAPRAVRANGTTQASPLSQIDQQLATLKAKLVDLSSRYTRPLPGCGSAEGANCGDSADAREASGGS